MVQFDTPTENGEKLSKPIKAMSRNAFTVKKKIFVILTFRPKKNFLLEHKYSIIKRP